VSIAVEENSSQSYVASLA